VKLLCLIPARRDSKGIPGKNWKPLNGKPLINYSIESALSIPNIDTICISTNSDEIIDIIQNNFDLKAHFKRPESLSTDYSSSREVILHAVEYFEKNNEFFDAILLLQPTSPLRKTIDIQNCISLFQENECEMVVSVCESPYNPYYNIYFENNDSGYIQKSIQGSYTRRQDCPPAYLINGSIYVISVNAIKENEIHSMTKLLKYVMPWEFNIDLDKPEDWIEMENLIKRESNAN
jgi:N-acylneuraminate cytidylyltransferase